MRDVIEFETKIEDSPRDYAAKISIISYQLAALEMETNSQYTVFFGYVGRNGRRGGFQTY